MLSRLGSFGSCCCRLRQRTNIAAPQKIGGGGRGKKQGKRHEEVRSPAGASVRALKLCRSGNKMPPNPGGRHWRAQGARGDCEGPRSGQESGLETLPWAQNTRRTPGLTISPRSEPDTFPILDEGNGLYYGKVRLDTRSPHLDRGLQGGCNVRWQRCKKTAAAAT